MFKASTVILAALAATAPASAQFYSMGRPPGDIVSSNAFGLSSDGRIAAGYVREDSLYTGYTWTAQGGRVDFGRGAGSPARQTVSGISGDGRYVIGGMPAGTNEFYQQVFRWSESTGFQALGTNGWAQSFAMDISHDGRTIVGELHDEAGGFYQPYRWTESGGFEEMLYNGRRINASVNAVTGDGNMVVGSVFTAGLGYWWTQETGYQFLDPVDGTIGTSTDARGVSSDGRYIVGMAGHELTGAMWTPHGSVNLGKLDGYGYFDATEVVDDGSVVAGTSSGGGGNPSRATIWTQSDGVQLLSDYLAANGVTIPMNVALETCTDMSADGMTFSGRASLNGDPFTTFGYVVSIPSPTTLLTLGGFLVYCRRKRS